ncbi:hypothetical protein C5167_034592 [Papaver somniferum]|uniref:Uncharacterized protein n=1 Tax=Papaver somniferum TaxID=3469 RepID=A0A4Y7KHI1_PAPSO|nr:hypothetical protein C5167_034592 [Papaver somniferum]
MYVLLMSPEVLNIVRISICMAGLENWLPLQPPVEYPISTPAKCIHCNKLFPVDPFRNETSMLIFHLKMCSQL